MKSYLWRQYSTTTTKNTLPEHKKGGGGGYLWLIGIGGGGYSCLNRAASRLARLRALLANLSAYSLCQRRALFRSIPVGASHCSGSTMPSRTATARLKAPLVKSVSASSFQSYSCAGSGGAWYVRFGLLMLIVQFPSHSTTWPPWWRVVACYACVVLSMCPVVSAGPNVPTYLRPIPFALDRAL